MRYGILSDVHSNLESLEIVLAQVLKEKPDRILCVGDSVGYGANPTECIELLKRHVHPIVCGNHDLAVAGGMDLDWFNETAKAAVLWTQGQLSEDDRAYLGKLPLVWKDSEVTLVHGSLHEPEKFHYVLNAEVARASFRLQETPVAFIGHTHVPGIFFEEQSQVWFLRTESFQVASHQKVLVNVGSVGQPRDGDPRAAWCLYDSESRQIQIRRVAYPIPKVQEKIRRAGLPELLAQRLSFGY